MKHFCVVVPCMCSTSRSTSCRNGVRCRLVVVVVVVLTTEE